MPRGSPAISVSSGRISRPRVTTACITCRDMKIKCDRTQPACNQCKKREKRCIFVDQQAQIFKFVNKPPDLVTGSKSDSTPVYPNSWVSIIESQAEIIKNADNGKDSVLVWAMAEAAESSRPQILQKHESVSRPDNLTLDSLGEKFIYTLMNDFPSRETCQPFFESFIRGIQPIVPVCHIPDLQHIYDEFWIAVSPSYSGECLALILAVLYTGATNLRYVGVSHTSTMLRLYEEIFSVVDFASYYSRNIPTSIYLLQGYIIMNTYKASHLAPFFAFGFLPQAIRFAQSLWLHVEKKSGDASKMEVQRRIWWHLVFLDVESSVATGLPFIIHQTSFTTQLPSVLKDGVNQATAPPAPPPCTFSPMMIAMQGHFQWAQRMQAWFEKLPSEEEVSQFKAIIQNLICLIDGSNPESDWARTYLHMQIDRAYCMLGLRFWKLDQYKGTACNSEVVETSRSFLTHYIQLSALSKALKLAWLIPGLIQPLHALIILLMHLSTCPSISREDVSRRLLDQTTSLRVNWVLNGSVLPGKALLSSDFYPQRANPRYLILVELRQRVWKKVGWDKDGKGFDPWGGRFAEGEDFGGGGKEAQTAQTGAAEREHVEMPFVQGGSRQYNIDDSTGLEGLDNILADDPMMDMFQWDEWEALASNFFAS